MLFTERRRLRELEEREAAGEDVWIDYFPQEALTKLSQLWGLVETRMDQGPWAPRPMRELLVSMFLAEIGEAPIASRPNELPRAGASTSVPDPVLNLLEAIYTLADRYAGIGTERVQDAINGILHSHRIAYKLIDGEIMPYRDDPVFASTIEPTVRLLVDKRFDAAQKYYRSALHEIRVGDAADAITDAGRALQDTLAALGYEGNTIARQLTDAKKKGLLAGHDVPLANALESAINWASAERSESGDVHKDSDPTLDDAWLAVQVIGALILRLASDKPRGTIPSA